MEGDTKCCLSDTLSPSTRSESFPPEVYAIARGANARLNIHPGGNSVRLPVYWDEFVIAIADPLWNRLEEECEESKLEDCFLFTPIRAGTSPYGGPTMITRR